MQPETGRASLERGILQALLYYDIWQYPLSAGELFAFLPVNSLGFDEFCRTLREWGAGDEVSESRGFYFLKRRGPAVVDLRLRKQESAGSLWRMARISMHIIKRFPFVRGVFVSGDLSKNATTPDSDVDFFVITAPGRLWITRSLLILFKKVFLLNSRKYFCLNYFATENSLTLEEHNVFLATEVAHLKPLYNSSLFSCYLQQNDWIRTYFPNFGIQHLALPRPNDRPSILQKVFETMFRVLPADRLDEYLQERMQKIWKRRYPALDESTRQRIFLSTRNESRAYVGDYQERILKLYNEKLREFGIE